MPDFFYLNGVATEPWKFYCSKQFIEQLFSFDLNVSYLPTRYFRGLTIVLYPRGDLSSASPSILHTSTGFPAGVRVTIMGMFAILIAFGGQ